MVLIRPRGGDFVYTTDEVQASHKGRGDRRPAQTHRHSSSMAQRRAAQQLGGCCVQVMLADIQACSELGAHGVVIGCLRPDGAVDVGATKQLVDKARHHVGPLQAGPSAGPLHPTRCCSAAWWRWQPPLTAYMQADLLV